MDKKQWAQTEIQENLFKPRKKGFFFLNKSKAGTHPKKPKTWQSKYAPGHLCIQTP